jgi:hypothetical protein
MAAASNEYTFGYQVFNSSHQYQKNHALNCTLRFYSTPTSGGLLQQSIQQVTTDDIGYVNFMTPITFPVSGSVYRTVQCNGDVESPRAKIGSRMFALQANSSLFFGGKAAADYLLVANAFSGVYGDLTGKPTIPAKVTSLPYANITGTPYIPPQITSFPYANLTGSPQIPSPVTSLPYGNITGTPTIPSAVTSLPYANITGTPTIPSKTTSLPYANITGTPTLPTNLSQLMNDVGFLMPSALSPYALTSALSSYALTSTLSNYVLTADTTNWDKNTADDLTLSDLSGYVLASGTTTWDKNAADDLTVESDPQTGAVTNNKWCKANGTAVNCDQDAPAANEVDPQMGAVESGKWCMGNGTAANCNQNAPAASVPSIVSQLDYVNYVTYFNEFNGDAVDTYPITLGTQSIQFTSQKFGTYRWITGTTIGNDAGIGLSYTTTTTGANYNVTYSYLDMHLMMASSAGYRMFIGFLKTSASADMTTINEATVFFSNTSYGGAYWYAMCCNAAGASNCEIVNTTVAKDTSFHRFTINATDTYALFYIDGIQRANISSTSSKYPRNVGYAYVGTYQETTDTAADNHQLDYIYLRTKRR